MVYKQDDSWEDSGEVVAACSGLEGKELYCVADSGADEVDIGGSWLDSPDSCTGR